MAEDNLPPIKSGELTDIIAMVQNNADIGEIIDTLGQELLANGFIYMEKLRRGQKIEEAEEVKQVEMQKQFRFLKSIYMDMIKMNRIKSDTSPNEKFNSSFLQKLKDKESTIGDIVGTIPQNTATL